MRADINLTPYIQPGRKNRIELWPYATIPRTEQPKQTAAAIEVRSILVGCAGE
ncbi:MAG: hypothetical protein NTW87_10530 [Planctomycetota bacterium]|nr:hypothetical protein [Planctomycetota bacterium]